MTEVHKGGLSAADVAAATNTSERGVRALLDALCAFDYVHATPDGRYLNSATVSYHLTSAVDPEADMKPIVMILSSPQFVCSLATLDEAVVRGGSVLSDHFEVDNNSWWEVFAKNSGNLMKSGAVAMTAKVRGILDTARTVLDVAAGSGQWGAAVVRASPSVHVTFNDYANVLPITRSGLEAELSEAEFKRVAFAPGNVMTSSLGGPYDVILAPNIIHHFSHDKVVAFFRRISEHLVPNGHIVVVELAPPDHPHTLMEGAFMPRSFSLSMLVATRTGKAYTNDEIVGMLSEAGFIGIASHQSFPFWTYVVAARA